VHYSGRVIQCRTCDHEVSPAADTYQSQLSLLGRLVSSSLGYGVKLIGAVVYLSCCTVGPIVRFREQYGVVSLR